MRRQFLRVYLGIAAVLVLAALAILFFVDREVRQVVDLRIEETMNPWVQGLRQRLLRRPGMRAEHLARMNEMSPFAVRILPLSEVDLPDELHEKIGDDRAHLLLTDEGRMVYARLGDDELIVLGPLHGNMLPPRGFGPHRGPPRSEWRGKRNKDGWSGGPGLFGKLPFQGAYFLIGVLLFILMVIGGAVYYLLRPFERRIYALGDVARQFGEGKFASRTAETGDDAIGALGNTFNQMAERTAGFIDRQRELLHAVSHELRTPLARLFFLVDDAQDASAPEEKNRYLQRIEGSLKELNDLVEELLTFERLEGQVEPQARETVDIETVLSDVTAVLADLRPELKVEVDGGDLEIMAIPRLFRRAAQNLATNAARYARQRVAITCVRQRDQIHLHVDDDGPGIPPEAREKVFEPFCRLDESRTADTGGAGLGLAIVQRIARLHDGQVRVDDGPLGGARFTLSLPAMPPS